jgi:hypothetical protein
MPLRRLLQSFVHNRNRYDRPQDEWTCGRAEEGCPCLYGPGKNGECRATFQCQPARKGDRWACTRQISLGGACATGPMPDGKCSCAVPPCRPRRSLRGYRRRATWLAVCAAIGGAVLILGGSNRAVWNSPGPITSQHATSAQRCADCHVEPNLPPLTPAGVAAHAHAQNELCLKCHVLGPQPSAPHGASTEILAELTAKRSVDTDGPALLAIARALAPRDGQDLACASCHSEHHGRDFDLRRVGNRECQACHQQQFATFASGHPEFTAYPYDRRTRIQFDHQSHWQRHFSDSRVAAVAPTSCTVCHEPAADGRQMRVKGFAQTCAPCHAAQIAGEGRAGDKGISFFQLPAFDLATLRRDGFAIGDYPEFAEGGLTPFMRWMLEGDPAAQAALKELGDVDVGNLARATPAQKAAAAELLWSVKNLFADLATQGQEVLVRRLGATAKDDPSAAARIGQLPADNLVLAQQSWLPGLLAEVAARRSGAELPPPPPPPTSTAVAAAAPDPAVPAAVSPEAKSDDDDLLLTDEPDPIGPVKKIEAGPLTLELADAEQRVSRGGWYRRDETYTLYYRPGGHADSFLKAWLDTTVRDPAPTATAIFAQLSAPSATGLCLRCHTVDDTPRGSVVNWIPRQPRPEQHEFTKFRHAAHFSLVGDQGCMTCHVMDGTPGAYAKSFGANRDPAVYRSNWVPITRNACTTCHRPGEAGMDCLLCHNYHTGEWLAPNVRASGFHLESVRTPPPPPPKPKP